MVLDRHLAPGLIPEPFGVEKYPVKVEYHGSDHVP